MTSFTGAERKIDRAREHVNALDKAIGRFLKTEPYEVERRLKAKDRIHEYVLVRYTRLAASDCLSVTLFTICARLSTTWRSSWLQKALKPLGAR
jgi:hypothetical protein